MSAAPAYAVEALKLRRSRTVWFVTLVLVILPPVLALGMVAAAQSDAPGALTAKSAALDLGTGWEGYFNGLIQIFASAGLVGVGVVVAWIVAREFVDRTAGALFASATSPTSTITAKLVLVTAWGAAVAAVVPVAALLIGLTGGWGAPTAAALAQAARLGVLALATVFLALPIALAASIGRGYLPAFGVLIGLVVLAQVTVIFGVGAWVPWSVPGLWAVSTADSGLPPVPPSHLLLAPASAVVVAWATVAWWRNAEIG